MYESYYGLSQTPFGLSPDINFCYRHRTYTKAKAYMQYALQRGEGFVVVTGRPGTGKTTLIQDLLKDLEARGRLVARIDSTQLDDDELLRLVTYSFGLKARGLDKATLIQSLQGFLLSLTARTGKAILIVDEAQNLSDEALEELRLITNLQSGAKPLVQIFLVGQESLRAVLWRPSLEQLHQRILAVCHLEPLDLVESREYILHRLLIAGWSGKPVFKANTLVLIFEASGGLPRLINKFCDRLLLHGCLEELQILDIEDARTILWEFQEESLILLDVASSRFAPADLPAIEDLCFESSLPPQPKGPAYTKESRSTTQAEGTGNPGENSEAPVVGLKREASAQTHSPRTSEISTGQDPTSDDSSVGNNQQTAPVKNPAAADMVHSRRGRRLVTAAAGILLIFGAAIYALQTDSQGSLSARVEVAGRALATRFSELTLRANELFGFKPSELDESLDNATAPFSPDKEPKPARERSRATDMTGRAEAMDAALPIERKADPRGAQHTVRPPVTAPHNGAGQDEMDLPFSMDAGGAKVASVPTGEPTEVRSADRFPAESVPREGKAEITGAAEVLQKDPEKASVVRTAQERNMADPPGSASEEQLTRISDDTGVAESLSDTIYRVDAPTSQSDVDTRRANQPEAGLPPTNALIAGETATLSLEKELRSLGYRVQENESGTLSFNLLDELPFASDSADIPESAHRVLHELANVFVRNANTKVTIIGHTDRSGPREYNKRLSLRRAQMVETFFNSMGVPEKRMSSQGRGEDAPLSEDGSDGAFRGHQRRIEILLEQL